MNGYVRSFLLAVAAASMGCAGAYDPVADESSSAVADSNPAASSDLSKLLFAGQLEVDVLELRVPPRGIELAKRLDDAIRKDPEWWQNHIKRGKPGEPLPYDPRTGFTESEYKEYLAYGKKRTFQKDRFATLGINSPSGGIYVLEGGSKLPELTGIKIDLNQNHVQTKHGLLTEIDEIDSPADSVIGAVRAREWKLRTRRGNDTIVAKFVLGQYRDTSRNLMMYDVRLTNAKGPNAFLRVLNYELDDN